MKRILVLGVIFIFVILAAACDKVPPVSHIYDAISPGMTVKEVQKAVGESTKKSNGDWSWRDDQGDSMLDGFLEVVVSWKDGKVARVAYVRHGVVDKGRLTSQILKEKPTAEEAPAKQQTSPGEAKTSNSPAPTSERTITAPAKHTECKPDCPTRETVCKKDGCSCAAGCLVEKK